MRAHYEIMLHDNEKRAKLFMKSQNMQPGSRFYGAYAQADGVYQAKHTIYGINYLISVYCNEESCYYKDAKVLNSILCAFDYVDRVQHENGLFDYVTCNFYSAPDTAFCIKKLIPVMEYFCSGKSLSEEESVLKKRTEKVVHAGARGLLSGGFHTPNHRWAIASMLAVCGRMFEEEDLIQAARQYLNEGIDCNEDGEFSEKSAGNYNRINNDAMLQLAEALKEPAYEQHAIRNLKMMLQYWEPDDSVFTANSTRFDKDRLLYPESYYYEYLTLGIRYDIQEFIAMANYIMDIVKEKQIMAQDYLMNFMSRPELVAYESDVNGIPTEYRTFFKDSGIVRGRRGHYTYTIMRGKSNFLFVHNGSIKLAVKIGGSFCEHRAFVAETLEEKDGGFLLHQTMKGWYYLPFEEKPETSDWWSMDNASREKKQGPDMNIDVAVREIPEGLEIELVTSGVQGAPWRVELAFQGIDRISNEHMTMPIKGDEVLVLKDSFFEVSNGQSAMKIGPAFGVHHFTEGKEDSEAKTPGAATVYMTDYTEFRRVIEIRL